MVSWVQAVVGAAVLWFPGLAWSWALLPGLGWVRKLVVSVVVAVTVQPGLMFFLNVFLGVPVTAVNVTLLSLGLGSLGLAAVLRSWMRGAWTEPASHR